MGCELEFYAYHSKNSIAVEGNGKAPHKVHTSLEKTQGPVSGFCYARNREWDAVNFKKSTSLEKKLRALSLVSATLESEYATQ